MNVKKIQDRFSQSEWLIYSNDMIRPFIDAYFQNNKFKQFQLFHSYIFDYDRVVNEIKMDHWISLDRIYPKEKIFNKDHKVNVRNKYVKYYLNDFIATFVGLFKDKKDVFHPIFLYMWFDKEEDQYHVNGFFTWDEKYDRERGPWKDFSKMKNKYVYISNDGGYSNDDFPSLYSQIEKMAKRTKN